MIRKDDVPLENIFYLTKIFINGNWVGLHKQPDVLVPKLRLLKCNNYFDISTSISWVINKKEIHIQTDYGRLCRPLFKVDAETGNLLLNSNEMITKHYNEKITNKTISWDELIHGDLEDKQEIEVSGVDEYLDENLKIHSAPIEYVDISESNTMLFATDSSKNCGKASHCEIHPSLILGVLGNCTPFPSHNQSPRNVYSTCQAKQGLGTYATNYHNRFDTNGYILDYPQKPLISNRYLHRFQPNLSYGVNTIVAIGCYTGYNVEDSIIINKSSLDRGLFRTTSFHIYQDTISMDEEAFYGNPKKNNILNVKKGVNYDNLDNNGVIEEETKISEDQVLIGKYNYILKEYDEENQQEVKEIKDNSILPKKNDKGYVDKVFVNSKNDNINMVKVRIRKTRVPEIGDKFCSRHGQKGVIGMLLEQQDMPYTRNGLVPDIIINPHAIPSRMTIGHLIECLTGKACSHLGFEADSTAFIDRVNPVENIASVLQDKCNYERYGNEILYNGLTGKQLEVDFFIGPTYYLRLKHMVQDKVHSRATGPKTVLSHQPASGRSNEGGLRIGEMERDAILSHGMTSYLKESYMEKSDKYTFGVCNHTGLMSVSNLSENKNMSPSVDGPMKYNLDNNLEWNNNNANNFSKVSTPLLLSYCYRKWKL